MRVSFLPALALVLALAACAGQTFDQHLRSYKGKPVNDFAIGYGPHTGQYQRGDGAIVYVWQKSQTQSVFGPAVTQGGYRIGSGGQADGGILWTGIQHNSCVIRAGTMDGLIRDISFEGNPGGCETIYGTRKRELGYSVSTRP